MDENNKQFAPAVTNAIKIIELLSTENTLLGISEISRKLDINKNMVYRVLNTLQLENWIYVDELSGKYQLTLQPFQYTSQSLQRLSLYNVTVPCLYSLWQKTEESVYLAVLKENCALYLQHLDSVKSVKVSGAIGGSYPLYCTAPGKVLLAFSDEEIIENYCTHNTFQKKTINTITDPETLKKNLQAIRTQGYATDVEEFGYGIVCYAAPVFDYSGKMIGTIGSSGSLVTCEGDQFIATVGKEVRNTANQITILLGGNPLAIHNDQT